MRTRILLYLSLFTLHYSLCTAQQVSRVALTRNCGPIFSYTKSWQENYEYDGYVSPGGQVHKLVDMYNILGGDFKDKFCQFTIAANTKISFRGGYEIYLAPSKADSVYVKPVGNISVTPKVPFYIEACGHEYEATFDMEDMLITVKPYYGKYVDTYILLYNNRLPDSSFTLENGKQAFFSKYEHKHRYIYVMTCDTQKLSLRELDTLKKVTIKYGELLTSVLIPAPDDSFIKPIKMKEWVIAEYDGFPLRELQINFFPNGALFDEDGNIVNKGILPSDLGNYLEKLEHKK